MIRIIGGHLKRRLIPTGALVGVRPTTDRVRESIFNILFNLLEIRSARVLDICAGSGALGFEALSRGAESSVFIERNRRNAQMISQCADTFGLGSRVRVLPMAADPALRLLAQQQETFNLVFCDPPYARQLSDVIFLLLSASALAENGAVYVAEHPAQEHLPPPPDWRLVTRRVFGDTAVDFYHFEKGA